MKLPGRRRTPDPARPGTVYRAHPSVGRRRKLGDGPPYLPERDHARGAAPATDAYLDDEDRDGQYVDAYDEPARVPDRGPSGPPQTQYGGRPAQQAGPVNPRPPAPGYQPPSYGPPRRRRRPGVRAVVLVLLLLLVVYPVLLGATAWTNLNRVDAIAPAHAAAEPPDTPGRTFLVVGSDSRDNLTAEERKRLGTGTAAGRRTDTIMLLHVPSGGGPTVLVSIPRDSYVPIPGRGRNKINAAYAFGGPALLVQTVESVSGLRIDDYVETGLGGFAQIVDAVGGVRLCPDRAIQDRDAHLDVKAGCQTMDGPTALGYARVRKADPRGDLGRVERQREVLAAIASKTLSPSTIAFPWRAFPAAKAGGGALTVDEGTSPWGVARFVLAMRSVAGGNGLSLTVPVGNPNLSTSAGSAVGWDRAKALQLFDALKENDADAVEVLAKEQEKP